MRVHAGVAGWLVIIVRRDLVNSAFAGISQGIALLTRREATMIAIANFIGLPLLFLSSTMIARSQMPGWMQTAASFNPVDWGVKAAREVVLPGTDWSSVGWTSATCSPCACDRGVRELVARVYRRSCERREPRPSEA